MKVKRAETADGKIELQITVPAARVQEAVGLMDLHLAMENGIDAQSTKDLAAAVKEKVGEAYYNSFVDYQVMRYLAPFAVTQEKIAIVGTPVVESMGKTREPGKDLSFKAIVIPKPMYEIDDFSPVSIQLPKPSLSEAEIDLQLNEIAETYTYYEKDEDRPLCDGDDLLFSIQAIDSKGEEVPSLTVESRAYIIGQNYIPGGFDDQLIGMEVGETKTFDITAKEFNRTELDDLEATETFTFTITILELQKRIIPAITDIWVEKTMPGISTVPELREEIRKQGQAYKEKELEGMKSFAAACEFAKRFKGAIPDELYEMTREDILSNMRQGLKTKGKDLQDFIKEYPGGEQQFSMQLMLQTREVLVQGFSLDAVARHLKLEVTDEDIAEAFHLMAPGHEQELQMEFEMTGRMYQIEEGALRNKANKWLVDNAKIDYL